MEGRGFIQVDDKKFEVMEHNLIILNAVYKLNYTCTGKCWNFWLLEYKIERNLIEPNKIYNILLNKNDLYLVNLALGALKEEKVLLSTAYFLVLYYETIDKMEQTIYDEKYKIVSKAIIYMREYVKNFSIEALSSYLSIEKRTLYNLFMRYLQQSPKKYYQWIRLEESKKYLETTKMPINQIAAMLNFSSPGHFSTAFKKEYATTPLEYRFIFNTIE